MTNSRARENPRTPISHTASLKQRSADLAQLLKIYSAFKESVPKSDANDENKVIDLGGNLFLMATVQMCTLA